MLVMTQATKKKNLDVPLTTNQIKKINVAKGLQHHYHELKAQKSHDLEGILLKDTSVQP